ncbi:hypothetical protein Csa_011770 [Cucumis sativus]|nr:hypothetical protein Csa_011770 [Cucumis sativus]
MASEGQQKFPPQKQQAQPGKQHAMDPTPQFTSPDYNPANKLQALNFSFLSYLYFFFLGKVALVTGGDSGIGRAVCYCFALEGAIVAFTYVKGQEDKDAKDTIEMIKKATKSSAVKDPLAIPADLGFDENCKRVVDEVVKAYGRIDILINNAAEQYKSSSVEDIDEERLLRVFRTNIFSYFFTTRHALKHMKEGSSIINTTSVNAYKGNAKLLDYTSTKGAIVAFTRGLALQLANKGIRVNGVAPGPIWTPLIPASFDEEETASFGSQVPMKRAGQPIEVAPSYVFLACNADSSYITGQVLHPNGRDRKPVRNPAADSHQLDYNFWNTPRDQKMWRRAVSVSHFTFAHKSIAHNKDVCKLKFWETFTTETPMKEKGTFQRDKTPFITFVLGGPGSGKGTQCMKIVENFGFTHLSAGDLLRREIASNSADGTMILNTIKEGKIVPSELTVRLIQKEMESSDNYKFLIDGFPRSEENRIAFEQIMGVEPDVVLFFDCPEDEMVKRVLNRNQGRVDDNIVTIKKRLKVFDALNLPVVKYYMEKGKLYKIRAVGSVDEIYKQVYPVFASLNFEQVRE